MPGSRTKLPEKIRGYLWTLAQADYENRVRKTPKVLARLVSESHGVEYAPSKLGPVYGNRFNTLMEERGNIIYKREMDPYKPRKKRSDVDDLFKGFQDDEKDVEDVPKKKKRGKKADNQPPENIKFSYMELKSRLDGVEGYLKDVLGGKVGKDSGEIAGFLEDIGYEKLFDMFGELSDAIIVRESLLGSKKK
jgi:hypothetical protein